MREPSLPETGLSKRKGLAFRAIFLLLTIGATAGLTWRIAQLSSRPALSRLSPEERQSLVGEALQESPGVFQPAWFEPRLGYTLRPGARLSAWDDSFVANRLGYRTHDPEKPEGTFRVLFVGDSWTYGMGISWRDSFPMQFETIANRRRQGAARVQAWSLALPGYNTLNELAALEFYFDRLRPDAVVLCPTPNDIDSSSAVTAEGMLARSRTATDDFGDPISYRSSLPLVDAPSFHRRWRLAFGEVARMERELRERRIPLFLFFTATWDDRLAHSLVAEGGLRSPYAITPPEITVGKWRNPPPFRHGTAAANQLYGRLAYELVAGALGWPGLGAESGGAAPGSERIFRAPPGADWPRRSLEAARKATAGLPEIFAPGPDAAPQCLAAMDCERGLAPRASRFLLRRAPGSSRVVVTIARLPGPTWLYPLALKVRVADDREGVETELVLRGEGGAETKVVLRSPRGSSAAIEVSLLAARASAMPSALAGQSLLIKKIEQR